MPDDDDPQPLDPPDTDLMNGPPSSALDLSALKTQTTPLSTDLTSPTHALSTSHQSPVTSLSSELSTSNTHTPETKHLNTHSTITTHSPPQPLMSSTLSPPPHLSLSHPPPIIPANSWIPTAYTTDIPFITQQPRSPAPNSQPYSRSRGISSQPPIDIRRSTRVKSTISQR